MPEVLILANKTPGGPPLFTHMFLSRGGLNDERVPPVPNDQTAPIQDGKVTFTPKYPEDLIRSIELLDQPYKNRIIKQRPTNLVKIHYEPLMYRYVTGERPGTGTLWQYDLKHVDPITKVPYNNVEYLHRSIVPFKANKVTYVIAYVTGDKREVGGADARAFEDALDNVVPARPNDFQFGVDMATGILEPVAVPVPNQMQQPGLIPSATTPAPSTQHPAPSTHQLDVVGRV